MPQNLHLEGSEEFKVSAMGIQRIAMGIQRISAMEIQRIYISIWKTKGISNGNTMGIAMWNTKSIGNGHTKGIGNGNTNSKTMGIDANPHNLSPPKIDKDTGKLCKRQKIRKILIPRGYCSNVLSLWYI